MTNPSNPSKKNTSPSKSEIKDLIKIVNNKNFPILSDILNNEDINLKEFKDLCNYLFIEEIIENKDYRTTSTINQYITTNKDNFTQSIISVEDFVKKFNNEFYTIKETQTEIQNTQNTIQATQNEIDDTQNTLTNTIDTNETNYQKLIREITSYKDNTMVTEFNNKLEDLESSYKEKLDKLNTDYETKFEDLNSKIAALLPSALMANLSSTYKQAKSNYQSSNLLLTKDETSGNYQYKPLSYKKGTRITFLLSKFNSFLIKSIRYFVFLAPLIFIICINLGIKFGTNINLNLADIKTANDVLLRLFFNVPLGIISFYGYNMIRNNNNMLEEYHHKENVISLYEGLIKQLKTQKEEQISKKEETTSTDELINKLHDLIINTVANNPNSKTKNSTIWENTLNIISNNILKETMNKVKNNHPKTP